MLCDVVLIPYQWMVSGVAAQFSQCRRGAGLEISLCTLTLHEPSVLQVASSEHIFGEKKFTLFFSH